MPFSYNKTHQWRKRKDTKNDVKPMLHTYGITTEHA